MLSLWSIQPRFAQVFLLVVAVAISESISESQEEIDVNIWALLVAGSKGYDNYRHQADVCHAYHILRRNEIPDERIVVMMYDDIAHNESNPTPGIILNHPKGSGVYAGVPKDYTGDLVSPENFLNILQGEQIEGGSGKVIASGPNDHVFVYFSDHGAPGLIAFPNDDLRARDLNIVLRIMHEQKKYGKLVFYLESCDSGPIFQHLLPDDINVYATTATNGEEESSACYYDDFRDTYLGDVYSVNWMEDSNSENPGLETLLDQFRIVKSKTTTSHVRVWGDLRMANMKLSEFQGRGIALPRVLDEAPMNLVASRDVPVAIVRRKLEKATDSRVKLSLKHQLNRMLQNRAFLKEKMAELVSFVTRGNAEKTEQFLKAKSPLKDHNCYEQAVRYFDGHCFDISDNPHSLAYFRLLVNLCEENISVHDIREAINSVCTHQAVVGIV